MHGREHRQMRDLSLCHTNGELPPLRCAMAMVGRGNGRLPVPAPESPLLERTAPHLRRLEPPHESDEDEVVGKALASGVLAYRQHAVLPGMHELEVVGLGAADDGGLLDVVRDPPEAAISASGRTALAHFVRDDPAGRKELARGKELRGRERGGSVQGEGRGREEGGGKGGRGGKGKRQRERREEGKCEQLWRCRPDIPW